MHTEIGYTRRSMLNLLVWTLMFMCSFIFLCSPPALLETVDLNNTLSDPEAMVRSQ